MATSEMTAKADKNLDQNRKFDGLQITEIRPMEKFRDQRVPQ